MSTRFLLQAVTVVGLGLLPSSCRDSVSPPAHGTAWEPSPTTFAAYPYARSFTVEDSSGQHGVDIEVRTLEPADLMLVRSEDFALEFASLETPETPTSSSDHGGGSDDESTRPSVQDAPAIRRPPLFLKITLRGDVTAPRLILRLPGLRGKDYGAVIAAGHYKSIVLRRPNATRWSYVTFYHHHGDWSVHPLYSGWFYRCTYAYDCYPNHGITSWRTTYYDEQVEFREDCQGRCP